MNIIFPSASCLNKDRISNLQKSVNMEFLAKEKIILLFFKAWKLIFLGSSNIVIFRKYLGKIIFLPISSVKKNLLLLQEINITFLYIQKIYNMNFSFLLYIKVPFIQSSCFCNNFFLSYKLVFPFKVLKDLNLHYK